MMRIALQMLFSDRGKYGLLLGGLVFATVLMLQQLAIFCGLLRSTSSTINTIRAPIWITDPDLEEVNQSRPLRDTDVFRVRSVPGVAWASPISSSRLRARLADGSLKPVQLIGVDPGTLAGLPDAARVISGGLEDLWLPNAVVIDDLATSNLSSTKDAAGKPVPVEVGDRFEIEDKEARVVAAVRGVASLDGSPCVFTTFSRAIQYGPPTRRNTAWVLAGSASGLCAAEVARRIREATGLYADVEAGFRRKSLQWQIDNSGLPFAFGITVALGVVVGLAIAGQTFYSFVLDNLKSFAALKAMGASDARLAGVLLGQVTCLGFVGFGLGALATAAMGFAFLRMPDSPFFLPWPVAGGVASLVLGICLFAALLGIVKIVRIEPASVFRT